MFWMIENKVEETWMVWSRLIFVAHGGSCIGGGGLANEAI